MVELFDVVESVGRSGAKFGNALDAAVADCASIVPTDFRADGDGFGFRLSLSRLGLSGRVASFSDGERWTPAK